MPDLATLQTRLSEAEVAYHKLQTGALRASVTLADGESITYTQASRGELRRYIDELRNQIADLQGTKKRGPVRFIF